jgi:hypothetical protein
MRDLPPAGWLSHDMSRAARVPGPGRRGLIIDALAIARVALREEITLPAARLDGPVLECGGSAITAMT